jgi:hypothetical protein
MEHALKVSSSHMLELPLVDPAFDIRIPNRMNSCWMHSSRYCCCNDGRGKDMYIGDRNISKGGRRKFPGNGRSVTHVTL